MLEVRREVVLDSPPEEVWEALTDAEQLGEWFANEVELDPRPGGRGVFRWGDGSVRRAAVDVVEHGRRFGFRWHEEDADGAATRVEITLEETAAGTRLTVVESAAAPATALAGEWSWGLALLASLPRLQPLARA